MSRSAPRFHACVVLLCCAFACAYGQAQESLTFEVASVRRSGPQGNRSLCEGGPETRDPGQIVCTNSRMKDLILWAYDLQHFQVTGPGWIDADSDVYDIHAKVPTGATYQQTQVMAQNLLRERFHLEVHHEARDIPVFELVIAKGGLKMKESTDEPFPQKPDYPILPPGKPAIRVTGVGRTEHRLAAHQATIGRILSGMGGVARPVIDKTGLKGTYDAWLDWDITLDWNIPRDKADDSANAPSLAVAIEQQLGLKFIDARARYDVVVVDRVDKVPVEN